MDTVVTNAPQDAGVASTSRLPVTEHLVVMGVSGSGKTTIAGLLAERLGHDLAEADEFHPPANIEKMSAGTPLTDADRAPWLAAIREWLDHESDAGRAAVVTCSALKRSYRDELRRARGRVRFVHLDGDPDLLAERITHRSGHFMPPTLLPSQLATLEPLDADEDGTTVDIADSPDEIVASVVAWLAAR
ncbi:gluconokinase [Isoptericola cucumis]|uniref:Gluconokinase n=1 Tax=Isoptericola cucumis TaxID=1776856 RepID=A0ABQ2B9R8_9MICO|nr:gluconokinase [Isoptericola cucumis]GGI10010.1 gluconokinase [Isoptericola cucumis]